MWYHEFFQKGFLAYCHINVAMEVIIIGQKKVCYCPYFCMLVCLSIRLSVHIKNSRTTTLTTLVFDVKMHCREGMWICSNKLISVSKHSNEVNKRSKWSLCQNSAMHTSTWYIEDEYLSPNLNFFSDHMTIARDHMTAQTSWIQNRKSASFA